MAATVDNLPRVSAVTRQTVAGALWWRVDLASGEQFGFTSSGTASGRYDGILKASGYEADYVGASSTFAGGLVVYLKNGGTATYNPGNFPSYSGIVRTAGPVPGSDSNTIVLEPVKPIDSSAPVSVGNKYSKWILPVGGVLLLGLLWKAYR